MLTFRLPVLILPRLPPLMLARLPPLTAAWAESLGFRSDGSVQALVANALRDAGYAA